jgi:hypothetical protein
MASKRKAGGVVAAKEPQIADSEDEALGDLDLDKYALLIAFFLLYASIITGIRIFNFFFIQWLRS